MSWTLPPTVSELDSDPLRVASTGEDVRWVILMLATVSAITHRWRVPCEPSTNYELCLQAINILTFADSSSKMTRALWLALLYSGANSRVELR